MVVKSRQGCGSNGLHIHFVGRCRIWGRVTPTPVREHLRAQSTVTRYRLTSKLLVRAITQPHLYHSTSTLSSLSRRIHDPEDNSAQERPIEFLTGPISKWVCILSNQLS